jgi:hypothetical protein
MILLHDAPLAKNIQLTVWQAFKVYSKADPMKAFVDIEKRLRAENCNVFLIALVCCAYSSLVLQSLIGFGT